ncbi:MAG: hypothetical protein ACM35H_06985, partial [Bacteroidota bacterium]|nr:hypothetical protein [Kiloniellaceae bacterium]
MSLLRLLALTLVVGLSLPGAARADLGEDLQGLHEESYDAKGKAVERILAGGDERAVPVLEAFLDGRLFVTKDERLVIGEDSAGGYRIFDALTGEALGEAGKRDVSKVKINNKLRQQVKGSLGALTLGSRDTGARIRAADALFRRPQAEMLPALEEAVARESDAAAEARLRRALAATRLSTSQDSAVRVAAVRDLGAFTDQEVRALVGSLLVTNSDGTPALSDAALRAAAEEALAAIGQGLA